MTIVLAGGSGFLGRALHRHFDHAGHVVRTLSRRPAGPGEVKWQPDGTTGPWADALADADVIVNLAGESLAGTRWNAARKDALRSSRILPARSIARALAELPARPRILITCSAIGFYGAHDDEPVSEDTPPGADFLARLCVDWEHEAAAAASTTTRVTIVRTGLVLHPDGGALKPMLLPFRLGIGGPLGSGRQYWSWIHLDDWVALLAWLATPTGAELTGVSAWNATAPGPVTNAEFSRILGRVLHRPAVIPVPEFALRLALGEFAQFLTVGARVLPVHAERAGFRFQYSALEPALRDLLRIP
jgi:uncharacterized protein (TIGR01777 family)